MKEDKITLFLIILMMVPVPFLFHKSLIMNEELTRRLNTLEQRVSQMETQRLSYPLDANSSKVVEGVVDDFLIDKVFDLTWKKMFHYITTFESINATNSGFGISFVGAGSATADGTQILLTTGALSGNSVDINKQPSWFGLASFSQKSNFRSAFTIGSIASQTIYIIVGATGANDYYGFKIVNGTLYGVTKDGTTENSVSLQSISASTAYNIEARYIPGGKVSFYVNATYKGTSNSNLPRQHVAGVAVVNNKLFDINITTNEAVAKNIQMSFFEFLQFRNILK